LIVSTNQNRQDILKTIEYGVNCYILKECDKEEIIGGIYAATKQEKFFCGKVLDIIMENLAHKCTDSHCDHCQPVTLTAREIEIVKLISEGYTSNSIAEKLHVSFHTVSSHRKNIFKKLNINNSSELLIYAVNKGIVNPGNSSDIHSFLLN